MKKRLFLTLAAAILGLLGSGPRAFAQGQLAATLEVLSPGVEVLRANTVNWIAVKVEAIVGVGDVIRTDDTGNARITFFTDGVDTDLLPNTEYRIDRFEGSDETFNLSVAVLAGRTQQQLKRLLDANSSYDIDTPSMILAARGTQFAVRVEASGRSAMLVSEGIVAASGEGDAAEVPPEFGIRAEPESALSDVVRAKTFDELDAALDGCTGSIQISDDASLNVRLSPQITAARVGTVDPASIDRLFGTSSADQKTWYRIAFRGGYGWIYATNVTVQTGCAGIRQFDANAVENPDLYEYVGDPLSLEDLEVPPVSQEATEEPDSSSQ